jgi:internalin A
VVPGMGRRKSSPTTHVPDLAEVETRIQVTLETRSQELNLEGLNLSELPDSLGQLTQLQRLDVSRNRLTQLPDSLSSLVQLRELNLYINQFKTVPNPIARLASLQILNLGENQLIEVPEWLGRLTRLQSLDVTNNQLSIIPDLSKLTHLESLYLYNNLLTSLPESLCELRELKILSVFNNRLTALPESLGRLLQLQRLHAYRNRLSELPTSLEQLVQLDLLDLSNNQLTTVPDTLSRLSNLQILNLSSNLLTAIPESLRKLSSLQELFLHDNTALGLPPEVLGPAWDDVHKPDDRTKPASPASILDYYFRTRGGKRPLNEAKLILVGRGGVGKTCLIKRLLHDTFDEHEKETPGIEIQPWEVQVTCGDSVRLHVWDFGGQEILHATHQFFLTERTLYLLVLSGREGKATEDAEYWLQLIRSFGGDSKVIVALNKSVQHPFDVNRGFLLEKYPCIAEFVKTDCEDGTGLADLKRLVLDQTEGMEHRKADFPKDWFAIKEHLAEMTKRNENYVTWEEYQTICRELGENDAEGQQKLAWYLNLLGIALNYRDDSRLKDTHVLNPRWVTEGIYPLLRAGQQQKREGVLKLKDLADALDPQRYPRDKHEFLVGLMQKFQLCFPLPERRGEPQRWLVPELLGENQPDIKALLEQPGLGFRYQYEVLPEGLLPRFIVQTHSHSEANPQWRWRTGVVLEWEGCHAVVRADYRERRVDVHVTGPVRRRRELLAVIREKIGQQHADLKGMRVEERVTISGEPGITVSYRDLLQREEDGEEEFRPEGARRKVRVTELLDGVESSKDRAERRERDQRGIAGDVIHVHGHATIRTGDRNMENVGRDKKTTNISVGTNYGQVGEVLNHCTNVINEQPEGKAKDLLDKLQEEVTALIKALPAEQAKLKEKTAKNLQRLVETATDEEPERAWYSVSAKGLLEASKFVKDFTGNITGTIGQLVKVLWPDFAVEELENE